MGKNKRVFTFCLCIVVVISIITAFSNGTDHHLKNDDQVESGIGQKRKAINSICHVSDYSELCIKSLHGDAENTSDPKELIKLSLKVAIDEIKCAAKNSTALKELINDSASSHAIELCGDLLDRSIRDILKSIDEMDRFFNSQIHGNTVDDLNRWLTGSITYQTICLDMFKDKSGELGDKMKHILKTSRELTVNGLNIVTTMPSILTSLHVSGMNKRFLTQKEVGISVNNGFPSWISTTEQMRLVEANLRMIRPDLIVAKNGRGKCKTINEALKYIPMHSRTRFVVYVKAGVYKEQVTIQTGMDNIMFIGDGPTRTKVTGSLSQKQHKKEINESATFSVEGSNFIARDMGFENTAGSEGGAAVALRVESNKSIFYNCQMHGYQDTLWAALNDQFYRDCVITGSIDFIFGKANAVFQNCKLVVRMSTSKNQNDSVILAGGREHKHERSALVLQNCSIVATPEYLANQKSRKLNAYLGRPWKPLARTVIMQSHIGGFINPQGYLEWPDHSNYAKTCLFAEYRNRGLGSTRTSRVKWPGVKSISLKKAEYFTAGSLIGGDFWVKPTGLPYVSGMIPGI